MSLKFAQGGLKFACGQLGQLIEVFRTRCASSTTIEPPPGQNALPDADIDAAEIAPLHPNVDVAVVNGDQEVEEV
jgi:hypothetical protein